MAFPFKRLQIEGHSMEPALCAGDRVLIRRSRKLVPGDVAAFEHEGRILVKRVVRVIAQGYHFAGDHTADSRDSRSFGRVSKERVIGKMILRYEKRPAVAGRVR